MKKIIILIGILLVAKIPCHAIASYDSIKQKIINAKDTRAVKSLLNSQVKYANREDFNKFINTYDTSYLNSDGLDYEQYSKLVTDIWNTYEGIKYGIKIKNIELKDKEAQVELTETSSADISVQNKMNGTLKSESKSIYKLKKINGKWKVVSDSVISEKTSMLYGEAIGLDIKLTAPNEIKAGTEYTASLEFETPKGVVSIASISSDKVEYPQKPTEEVFRKMPEDNILERLFTSNSENKNEYIIASIGLTKANVCDLSIQVSLVGFGYQVVRVNVLPQETLNNQSEVINDKEK